MRIATAATISLSLLALSFLSACSTIATVETKPGLEICLDGTCAPAEGRYSREAVLGALLTLLKENERVAHQWCETDPQTQKCRGGNSIAFFVQGGPVPGVASLSDPIHGSVSFDWSKMRIGYLMNLDALWMGTPVFCRDAPTKVTLGPRFELLVDASIPCAWTLLPALWNAKFAIERIDFDRGAFYGRYAVQGGGLMQTGGGSGTFAYSLTRPLPAAGRGGTPGSLRAVGDLPGDFMLSLAPPPREEGQAPVQAASVPAYQSSKPPASPHVAADRVAPVITAPDTVKADGAVAEIAGRLEDASGIASFAIDGQPTPFGADGRFTARRAVPIGDTEVVLEATDTAGNRAERKVAVTRPPQGSAAFVSEMDLQPPVIEIPSKLETIEREIEIAGRITDKSAIFEARADGIAFDVAADGAFRFRRPVPLGSSTIRLSVTDKWGNRSEGAVAVSRLAPQVAGSQDLRPDATPPRLIVPPSIAAEGLKAVIAGRVVGKSPLYSLTIAGIEVKFGADGSFRDERYAPLGTSEVRIEATDVWGNRAEAVVVIERQGAVRPQAAALPALNPTRAAARKNPEALALVIGIEDYPSAPRAEFAESDARVFFDYATNALGVPGERVKLLAGKEAAALSIFKTVDMWLRANTVKGKSDVFVFFAGHGLASADGRDVFLLPVDGDPNYVERTAIRRSELLEALNRSGARSVTVLLDTCYSGADRSGATLIASARPVLIKALEQAVPQTVSLLSAAAGDEISSGLPSARHGLFSYFLMRALEGEADAAPHGNADRTLTLGEIQAYLQDNVGRQAAELGRTQTPQLQGDAGRVVARW